MSQQQKGRAYQKGAARPAAKLTDEQIIEIRQAYAHGGKQVDIADQYGITQGLVSLIVNGKRWTHVAGPRPLTQTPEEQDK